MLAVSALQVLAAIRQLDKPASEVWHRFYPLPQILRNVKLPRKPSASEIESITGAAAGRLGKMGRLLVRPKGASGLPPTRSAS